MKKNEHLHREHAQKQEDKTGADDSDAQQRKQTVRKPAKSCSAKHTLIHFSWIEWERSTYSADWASWHPQAWFSGGEEDECICSQNHNPKEERGRSEVQEEIFSLFITLNFKKQDCKTEILKTAAFRVMWAWNIITEAVMGSASGLQEVKII